MPAHTVPGNAHAALIQLSKGLEERFGQLVGDVAVHAVVCGPGIAGGVDVEAGAAAEVVGVVFALDLETACCLYTMRRLFYVDKH